MSEEGESVQVAVRMRVFNQREKDAGASRIIRMERQLKGSNTFIANPETKDEKKFSFDYSFQSHSKDEPGIGDYATQDTVFEDLGRPVMTSALEGRNVCLFAYGQTGAGKSFSMLGKPDQPGIIPRTCNAIFDVISANDDPSYAFSVDIQVVEVYCEMVNDLLADRKVWPSHGHKPRLTNNGYVVDTVKKPCTNYGDIEGAFTFADKNRSIGSHALNPESSRAHTIYTINYERAKRNEAGKIVETVTSRLNLVDLAGSERTESAGTSGDMLKEGNAINLSLTALGSCIKCLSERKKPNFRDSKLTLLLQGSMTNGKVVMIAALSPAHICYDESMSTLRFADRIKQVKIRVSKNVSADPVAEMKKQMELMREQMQAEIDNLRGGAGPAGGSGGLGDAAIAEQLKRQEEENEQLRLEYERKVKEMNETSAERAARAADIEKDQRAALGGASTKAAEDIKEPHLLNLHEDPRMAECLVYPFKPGITVIGRMNNEHPPDLEFGGMGIMKDHCKVDWHDNTVWLTPGPRSRTVINGKPVDEPVELKHNNRVWLGNNYAFRFAFPGHEAEGEQFEVKPDYAFAENEIAENASFDMGPGADGASMPTALARLLTEALKRVEQANIIAMDLGKNCEFEPKIYKNRITGEPDVVVKVISPRGVLFWPWQKFSDRVVLFVQQWQDWQRTETAGEKWRGPPESEDPFVDHDYQLIGEAEVWLQSLANMIEHEANATILSLMGQQEGRIKVELMPCDHTGREGPFEDDEENDPYVDDIKELEGESIKFAVKIHHIVFDTTSMGDGQAACKYMNTFVSYKVNVKDPDEEWSRTKEAEDCTFNPMYHWSKQHELKINPKTIDLLQKRCIAVRVYGKLSEAAAHQASGADRGADTEIARKKKELEDLDRQIQEKKRMLG